MHGLSRLSNGVSSLSPPSSPATVAAAERPPAPPPLVDAVVARGVSVRRGVLLFAPLLYISGMLMYMGIFGFDAVNNISNGARDVVGPGSVYRSPQLMNVWNPKLRQGWKPCIKHSVIQSGLSGFPKSNGFLIIEANGGLNQQRLSICDAVAVAGLLNATLVIPIFHLNSVWQDSSKFGDIFDEEFFIYALRNHVNVIRELPEDILQQFDNNISNIVNLRVKAWSSQHTISKRAVRIAPFSNRLAHAVPPYVQGLRCLCNFEALRFSEPIRMLAAKMVDRMVKNSSKSGGKYVSVHLRFEEVGMMLRGMGFDNTTSLYVAAGKIYRVEKHMAPLKQMFPGLETKETLASPEELAPFMGHSSRLAALDYTVCLHSEVFVTTQGDGKTLNGNYRICFVITM
ncbi:UNVERIFIED_CONTAM: O-fucosyltransferase 9 [Sesamum calycinum]|uniref:O-fucosyltransferase family protein n=1 Tax=Sesamum calycinum TaxID=2727403 RepID=A0AAW2P7U0_9LAMI